MHHLIDTLSRTLAATLDLVTSAKRWWFNKNDGSICYDALSGWFVSVKDEPPVELHAEPAQLETLLSLDTMVWLQPSWDVSGDGALETRAFVYALKDGRFVPGLYSSHYGGEPVICVCDEFPFPTMESARTAARELTWSEHCSVPGPIVRSPAFA
jgi:hypothetical protein